MLRMLGGWFCSIFESFLQTINLSFVLCFLRLDYFHCNTMFRLAARVKTIIVIKSVLL